LSLNNIKPLYTLSGAAKPAKYEIKKKENQRLKRDARMACHIFFKQQKCHEKREKEGEGVRETSNFCVSNPQKKEGGREKETKKKRI